MLRALFKSARSSAMPAEIASTFSLDKIDDDTLKRYNALLGFAPDALPITFYYLLTQRAHLATMLGPEFPFRLAGMVHVENDIRELQKPGLKQPMELSTRVVLEPPAENGARYCELLTIGSQQGREIFECRSRYLAVRGKRKAPAAPRSRAVAGSAGQRIGEWLLSASAGREYAAVSGDWNPIHLWPWSARLLGMNAPIIHGMHSVARACAVLERAEGVRLSAISARFKAPIPLGSPVELRLAEAGTYQLYSGVTLAVEGNWR